MTSHALVERNQQMQNMRALAHATMAEHTEEEWQALFATLGSKITRAQFTVFMTACRRLQLDPFAKQIQCWPGEGGGITIYTTIDGLRVVASRSGKYEGQRGPFWCGKDGGWRDSWTSDEPPVGAKFGVVSKDFDEPVWAFARFKSYNKGTGTWTKYPEVMLAKVAESLALRRAFPNETSGLYSDVELGSVETVDADEPDAEPDAEAVESEPVGTFMDDPATAARVAEQTAHADDLIAHPGKWVSPTKYEAAETPAAKGSSRNRKPVAQAIGEAPLPALHWADLKVAAAEVGIIKQEDFKDIVVAQTGKEHSFTAADYDKVARYIGRLMQQKQAAEARVKPAAKDLTPKEAFGFDPMDAVDDASAADLAVEQAEG